VPEGDQRRGTDALDSELDHQWTESSFPSMLRRFSRAHRSQNSTFRPFSIDVTQVSGTSPDSVC